MIRFALIGCGRIAKRHSELLGLNEIKGANLSAVCDVNKNKARAIGERFKVPFYTDVNSMLLSEKIDVFVVLTESGNHAKNVIELSKFGKHIIVEKPMALTLKDADEMINLCKKNNIELFVIKQNRFNVPVMKLREALIAGRFGKLILGTVRVRWCRKQEYYDQDSWRGTWAMDGGVLTNQASHHIDLLQYMMGDVHSVFARSFKALANIEAEDTAVVSLKFCNGALGVIEATTATRPKDLEGSISILGEEGTVEISGFAVNEMKTWEFTKPIAEDEKVMSEYSVNPPNVYGFGHKAFYEHVVDCIIKKTPNHINGEAGRKSLELINAIYASIETGKEVILDSKIKKIKLGVKNNE